MDKVKLIIQIFKKSIQEDLPICQIKKGEDSRDQDLDRNKDLTDKRLMINIAKEKFRKKSKTPQ